MANININTVTVVTITFPEKEANLLKSALMAVKQQSLNFTVDCSLSEEEVVVIETLITKL